MSIVWKPTQSQIAAAHGKYVPDLIAPNLKVLFCGINPGLYSGAVGHHFARPGNRFWPTLQLSGFTPRRISPFNEHDLLSWGLGITNIVRRATAGADELTRHELCAGAKTLIRKVKRYSPRFLAILGVGAYRNAFGHKAATFGPQNDLIGTTRVWVLPNPSGLNAHYQLADLAKIFRQLRIVAT